MASEFRLSKFSQVVVSARISKSGQAAPAPGDLLGQSTPVANDARGVAIEINQVVKN
jgi:cytochrome c-type biogenesis protein CcmH